MIMVESVVIAKIFHAAPAWWRFATSSDNQRLGLDDNLLWTPAQRSLSEVHVMFCECYFLFIFLAALCSGPG